MNRFNLIQWSVAGTLLLMAGPALSAKCGDISPRWLELEDQYYQPTTPSLPTESAIEQKHSDGFEELLDGSFNGGSGTRITCLGTGDRVRAVTMHFHLQELTRQTSANGEHWLSALQEVHTIVAAPDDRISNRRSIQSVRLTLPDVLIWNPSSTGQGFEAVSVNRRKNALNATLLQEQVWSATPSKDGIEIELHDYVNGYYGGSMLWRLERS